jgi:D-psicose/D-tagatose/L-ribulose 3-epimerase
MTLRRNPASIHASVTFHVHIEEADMGRALDAALPHLAHFELDQNHRGHPAQGAIDFEPLLARLFEAAYDGIVGIEAFSRNVIGAEIGGAIGIWRDLFDDGDVVAHAGMALIRRGSEELNS